MANQKHPCCGAIPSKFTVELIIGPDTRSLPIQLPEWSTGNEEMRPAKSSSVSCDAAISPLAKAVAPSSQRSLSDMSHGAHVTFAVLATFKDRSELPSLAKNVSPQKRIQTSQGLRPLRSNVIPYARQAFNSRHRVHHLLYLEPSNEEAHQDTSPALAHPNPPTLTSSPTRGPAAPSQPHSGGPSEAPLPSATSRLEGGSLPQAT